jgi:hypothetical protein
MYENRIYVVTKTNQYDNWVGKFYAEVNSMFNLGYVAGLEYVVKNFPNTDCYICDNDDLILDDKYGDKLTEIPVECLIEELEPIIQKCSDWCNAPQLCSFFNMLVSLAPFINEHRPIVCLHYGY